MVPHEALPSGSYFSAATTLLTLIACVVLSVQPATAGDPTDVAGILAKIRAAVGYHAMNDLAGGLVIEGVAEYEGLKGPYRLVFTPDGKFIETIHVRRDQISAFDGRTGWGADWSGTPRILQLDDLEREQTAIWGRTARWLDEHGPFRIELDPATQNDARVKLLLHHKHGIRTAEMLIDRSNWLPIQLTNIYLSINETWEYQDYRLSNGLKLAHRVIHRFGGLSDTYEVHSVVPAPATSGDPFRPVLDLPHDAQFDSSVPCRFEVKQPPAGHLFVRPKVNGREVGWFAFDTGTGAGMTIAPSLADRLGMPSFGKIVRGGAGKFGVGKLREGKTFELGSLKIRDSIYVEIPQEFCDMMTKLFGIEIVGTCGYDVFSRAVVELDLKAGTACCHNPVEYNLPDGQWETLVLNRKIPCVNVTYEGGREGLFQFDTGAGTYAIFHAPAVQQLKLLDNRKARRIKVGGVGGTLDAQIGSLDWFQVGGRRTEKLTAIFLEPHEGALNDPYVTGTFGAGLLRGTRVVFDYPHRRIAFISKG